MTDEVIEEIYLVVEAAHRVGQNAVPVHAFPFRMTTDRLNKEQDNPWLSYWENLKTGYDLFEQDRVPPMVSVSEQRYQLNAG